VPAAQVTETQAAIRAAEEVGAPSVPKAALHLKMAKDQLQTAQALMAQEDNEQAKLTLDRARVDGELALALAREAAFRQKAVEALDKIKKLREEAGNSKPAGK
jgi:putative IMPACT (imprinted ancient) family translation regulator